MTRPSLRFIMPLGNAMDEEVKFQKIEYYRQVKPPTLKQFLYRRAVREAMAKTRGKTGITVNPATGLPIPESSLAAREALKGLTTEKIMEEHPAWVDEYKQQYAGKEG